MDRKLLRWILKLSGDSWQCQLAECSTAGLQLERRYDCMYLYCSWNLHNHVGIARAMHFGLQLQFHHVTTKLGKRT